MHKGTSFGNDQLYIEQIYVQEKMKPLYCKLIFKTLSLATECKFTFALRFFRQIDGCAVRGPFLFTFSYIYMTKMENEIVAPFTITFY